MLESRVSKSFRSPWLQLTGKHAKNDGSDKSFSNKDEWAELHSNLCPLQKKRKCVKVLLLSVIHNVVREVISSISSGILSGPGCAEICAGRSKVLSSSRPHSKSYTLPEWEKAHFGDLFGLCDCALHKDTPFLHSDMTEEKFKIKRSSPTLCHKGGVWKTYCCLKRSNKKKGTAKGNNEDG